MVKSDLGSGPRKGSKMPYLYKSRATKPYFRPQNLHFNPLRTLSSTRKHSYNTSYTLLHRW